MMTLSVHVVTAEREVYTEDGVDEVIAPGIEGELTVLPHHAPLLTMIKSGVLRLVKGSDETDVAITGGFLEVKDDRVTILADAAERAEEIDTVRAEEARRRAERTLEERDDTEDLVAAAASLQRSLLRLRAAERRRRRSPRGPSGPPGV
ncbi:MAG: F0F1 ATP synthase subunit epsilon [Chloroflexi bacterium]|nr:F0F1 ATP synthase subunit epsilon [Chloroflexota bacterium]